MEKILELKNYKKGKKVICEVKLQNAVISQ